MKIGTASGVYDKNLVGHDSTVYTYVYPGAASGDTTYQVCCPARLPARPPCLTPPTSSPSPFHPPPPQSPILHHVLAKDLVAETTYYYIVGNDDDGWSAESSFKIRTQ